MHRCTVGRQPDNVPACDPPALAWRAAADSKPMPTPPLLQRLARIAPYFRSSRLGFVVAIAAAATAGASRATNKVSFQFNHSR